MEKNNHPTILIVDDIEVNILIIENAVRGLEVNIITATSGKEALEKIRDRDLALALIDMEMPVMGGQELAREINSAHAGGLVPIIFVTAYSFYGQHLQEYYQHGIIDFIIKPFHRNILVSKINILLELYRQKQRIRESEKMYRMLLDASPEGIIIMNLDGRIIEISSIALKVFNITAKEDCIGNNIVTLFPPEEHTRLQKLINTTLEQGLTQNVEFTLHTADQKQFLAEISTTLIFDENGDNQSLMAIMRDITERKRMEQQLVHTERMAGLGVMAAGIAHEINQPLNIISIGLENLLDEAMSSGIDTRYLQNKADKIFENLSRIDKIIDNIRKFSRTTDGDVLSAFSINESIISAIALISGQLTHAGIELSLELDESLKMVVGSTYKFEQVILNFVINAKDAIEDRKRLFDAAKPNYVRVKSYCDERSYIVDVTDNGIGIKSNELDKIMLPFHTTKEAGKGTGLGLSISFEIIREMKGHIEVLSEYSVGTTLRIVMPKPDKSKNQ
ncbi:MAG: PAS domain S-box protein [Bacteroidota bacterium]